MARIRFARKTLKLPTSLALLSIVYQVPIQHTYTQLCTLGGLVKKEGSQIRAKNSEPISTRAHTSSSTSAQLLHFPAFALPALVPALPVHGDGVAPAQLASSVDDAFQAACVAALVPAPHAEGAAEGLAEDGRCGCGCHGDVLPVLMLVVLAPGQTGLAPPCCCAGCVGFCHGDGDVDVPGHALPAPGHADADALAVVVVLAPVGCHGDGLELLPPHAAVEGLAGGWGLGFPLPPCPPHAVGAALHEEMVGRPELVLLLSILRMDGVWWDRDQAASAEGADWVVPSWCGGGVCVC